MCLAMNPDVLKPGQRAHPRPIVTSKDAKAAAAERISYRRQWRLAFAVKDALWMYVTGTLRPKKL